MITMNCAGEYVLPSDYLWLMKITQELTFSLIQRKNMLRILRLFVADFSFNIKPIERLTDRCNVLFPHTIHLQTIVTDFMATV